MRGWITLAIVLVIVVVLGGTLVPCIYEVQTGAHRMRCMNNLKQIALALHNYHDTYNSFPMATEPHETLSPEKRLSWMPSLLPYMECMGGRVLLDPTEAWDGESNRIPLFQESEKGEDEGQNEPRRTVPFGPYKPFLCPVNYLHQQPGLPPFTHYVGVSGIGPDAAKLPADDTRIGYFGHDRKTRMADVTDSGGTADTLLLIETATENGPWTAGGYPTVRGPDPDRPPHVGRGTPFSSRHWGEVLHVARGDGSVRAIAPTIAPEVFEALATIQGGEMLPPDW